MNLSIYFSAKIIKFNWIVDIKISQSSSIKEIYEKYDHTLGNLICSSRFCISRRMSLWVEFYFLQVVNWNDLIIGQVNQCRVDILWSAMLVSPSLLQPSFLEFTFCTTVTVLGFPNRHLIFWLSWYCLLVTRRAMCGRP